MHKNPHNKKIKVKNDLKRKKKYKQYHIKGK
jgi:hypothetical protein